MCDFIHVWSRITFHIVVWLNVFGSRLNCREHFVIGNVNVTKLSLGMFSRVEIYRRVFDKNSPSNQC